MRTPENILKYIIDTWKGFKRWQKHAYASYENDIMHSWKTAMQALVALALERNGKRRSDEFEILTLALVHDISEAIIGGDVPYPIKRDPRMEGMIDEIEAEEVDKVFSELPPMAEKFLKEVNHLQGNKEIVAGRFFEAVEFFGYASFALAEICANRGTAHAKEMHEVIILKHKRFLELTKEFKSFAILYEPFLPYVESPDATDEVWNLEMPLRRIVEVWRNARAWSGFDTEETVLERIMKIALLAAIMLPIEIRSRESRRKKKLDGFNILSCCLVHDIPKSSTGALPYRLKTNPKFKREKFREIEQEHMQKILAEFPEKAKIAILSSAELEHDKSTAEGRFFVVIKNFSHLLFAFHEYKNGKYQYAEVLKNCYPILAEYGEEFVSFETFFAPIRHEVISIVEGKSQIWV